MIVRFYILLSDRGKYESTLLLYKEQETFSEDCDRIDEGCNVR